MAEMLERLAAGDVRALARACSMVEDSGDGVEELLEVVGRFLEVRKTTAELGGSALRGFARIGPATAGANTDDSDRELMLDHLGIAVRSIAAARGFYEMLGMRVEHEETVEFEQVKTAMLPMGSSKIELLEATTEDSTIGRFVAKRGEGLHHVALRVDRLEERFREMQAAGVRLASDRVRVGAGGHRYFFVHPASTGGVLVELVEAAT